MSLGSMLRNRRRQHGGACVPTTPKPSRKPTTETEVDSWNVLACRHTDTPSLGCSCCIITTPITRRPCYGTSRPDAFPGRISSCVGSTVLRHRSAHRTTEASIPDTRVWSFTVKLSLTLACRHSLTESICSGTLDACRIHRLDH